MNIKEKKLESNANDKIRFAKHKSFSFRYFKIVWSQLEKFWKEEGRSIEKALVVFKNFFNLKGSFLIDEWVNKWEPDFPWWELSS